MNVHAALAENYYINFLICLTLASILTIKIKYWSIDPIYAIFMFVDSKEKGFTLNIHNSHSSYKHIACMYFLLVHAPGTYPEFFKRSF